MNNVVTLKYLNYDPGGKTDIYDSLCLDSSTGELFLRFERSSNNSGGDQSDERVQLSLAKVSHPKYFREAIAFLESMRDKS
ncbi:hypothetical protein CKQ84_02930 [Shewanella sp. WE21]|jgi:hypothetical protein|uniref:hypothetical protein n=1 Tax=Shewanella sp. WE21 TaxID=2029986 RepID=UPI000CF72F00|nr:hypothetical protein [Shewanella sp. WE21]AVI64920.1 hypothetical protein CKQ84_02930 [Shewanella sp. WE21]